MVDFLKYSESIENLMQAWYQHTAETLQHGGDLGYAREHFVESVLKAFLPRTVIIGSGEIIDTHGERSGQQDVIVYQAGFPVFTSFTPVNTFLAEGVIAVMEVKSDFRKRGGRKDGTALDVAFHSARQVRKLTKNYRARKGADLADLMAANHIKTYVIGYRGWKDECTFKEHYLGAANACGLIPTAVYQPGRFVAEYDPIYFKADREDWSDVAAVVNEAAPMAMLLYHLLKSVLMTTHGLEVPSALADVSAIFRIEDYFGVRGLRTLRAFCGFPSETGPGVSEAMGPPANP